MIGTFRAGQAIELQTAQPLAQAPGAQSCAGGWVAVEPRGYVCASEQTQLGRGGDRSLLAAAALPRRDRDYPLRYGIALGSPRYLRIPSPEEQRRVEPGLDEHLARWAASRPATAASGELPSPLARALAHSPHLRDPLDAFHGMKVAWATELVSAGRTWLLTPELVLLPKDKVEQRAPLEPMSVVLGGPKSPKLPLAIAIETTPRLDSEGQTEGEPWPRRALVPLRPEPGRRWNAPLLRTSTGGLVHAKAVSLFEGARRPSGVGPHDKWVLVRINRGALLAYEGDRPVFAAAISPGIHGASPGPHRTPPGRYRVSSKSVTADMTGQTGNVPWRSREVPWVAYYDGSYALHGAWWHDQFGRPRSHGCINLTPPDARWLLHWLEPALPPGWHTVRADPARSPGTLVVIRR